MSEGGTWSANGAGWSGVTAAAGFLSSVAGQLYAAIAEKGRLRSAAMDAEFAGTMASINARAAEREANAILMAGRQQQALLAARYGQARSDFVVDTAARGIRQGGSAAEVRASMQLAKEQDLLSLRQSTAMASESARSRSVDLQNQALLARTSAANLRSSGGLIKPWGRALGAALESIGGASGALSSEWKYQARRG